MTVTVAQLGVRTHYAVPRILHSSGKLERLYTDAYAGNKPLLRELARGMAAFTGSAALLRLSERNAPGVPAEKVTSFDLMQMRYIMRARAIKVASPWDLYRRYNEAFARAVVKRGFGAANAVYGFDGASLVIFRHAKGQGLKCLLDQTIVPYGVLRSEMRLERKIWVGWESSGEPIEADSDDGGEDTLERWNSAEWDAANIILCGSQFVADSIDASGGPREKCIVVPYGYDKPSQSGPTATKARPTGRPLRLLFVGGVCLRKGVPYLLEALLRLPPGKVETRMVGLVSIQPAKLGSYRHVAEFTGALPRSQMLAQYEWADALVLPSLCEGSAMVTHEAQQFGLPVICTPNAGADIIEGVTGLTVAPRNTDALLEAICQLPDLLVDPRRSYADALRQGSFVLYRERLIAVFEDAGL